MTTFLNDDVAHRAINLLITRIKLLLAISIAIGDNDTKGLFNLKIR